jgi:Oxidoreductase family, NAD-binding Rossmann fold
MSRGPVYAILGRGRWAGKIHTILTAENRDVFDLVESRQGANEGISEYRSRLADQIRAQGAQAVWLCVPPGPHVNVMIESALDAGVHVIAEKPWYGSRQVTTALIERSRALGRIVAINYEYCFLQEVETWRINFASKSGIRFGGRFFLNRVNRTGVPAIDNLGSHLASIRAFAVPKSELADIHCGYEQADERCAWLERESHRFAFIDLLAAKEPIIQRFIEKFEAALEVGGFSLDLNHALRVAEDLAALR